MKIKTGIPIVFLAFFAQGLLADNTVVEGQQLFTTYCSACHGLTGGMDMSQRVAPPIIAVKMHYIQTYNEQASFVKAITGWVAKPDEAKTLMPGAIRRFNVMPVIPVTSEDAKKIATYIFKGDVEKPQGFDQHFQQRHGKSAKKNKKSDKLNIKE